MKKNTFLLEIYIEEIPINFIKIISDKIFKYFNKELIKHFINFKKIEYILTNKRIGFIVYDIFYKKEFDFINIKGPNINLVYDKDKKFNFLFNKWINKNKIKLNNIKYTINDKGIWLYYIKKEDNSINNILFKIIKKIIENISLEFKIMRWNNINNYFIRPIRYITILLNNKIINGNIFDICINRITEINKSIKNNNIIIYNVNQYKKLLYLGKVIINNEERKKIIKKELLKIENTLSGKIIINENILNKLSFSTEYPIILYTKINNKISINENILIDIIYNYYDYLLIYDYNNKLLPYFIWISNLCTKNYNITKYFNNKLINSLLKNIEYLYKLDINTPLENSIKKLKNIIFRKKLGNLYDKIIRVKKISILIGNKLKFYDIKKITLLSLLYKYDITTNIVKEFPLLQGIAGMYYSLQNNISYDICLSIKEQYNYKLIENNKSSNILSFLLAISDKIDTIIGNLYSYFKNNNFNLNFNNDPFCIKRDFNHIINLLINNKINILIINIFNESIYLYKLNNNNFINYVKNFIIYRINIYFLQKKYSYKIINSILCNKHIDIFDINLRLISLTKNDNYILILNIYKRILNLIEKYNNFNIKKDNFSKLDNKFISILNSNEKKIFHLMSNYKYEKIIQILINICKFIDNFLNKYKLYKNKNNIDNKIYLLNKSIKILSTINNISIL